MATYWRFCVMGALAILASGCAGPRYEARPRPSEPASIEQWLALNDRLHRYDTAVEQYDAGVEEQVDGHCDQAIAHFSAALAADPQLFVANANRGVCHIQLEQYDEALADADRALELAPWFPEAYLVRADVLTARGDLYAALADCDTAVKTTPDDMTRVLAVSLKCRGAIGFALGHWADAVRDLQFVDGSPDAVNTDRALMPIRPTFATFCGAPWPPSAATRQSWA